MDWYLLAIFFCLGAIFASFAGVLAGRLNTGLSIVHGRSKCDACGKELDALALVPIFSYLAHGGRARCCGARVSPHSTLGELLLGALFALSAWRLGFTLALLPLLAALVMLYALVLYDLAHTILPVELMAPFLIFALSYSYLINDLHGFFLVSGVAFLLALFLFLLYVLSWGRAMGLMDAPFALGLGFIAGPLSLSGFIYSFWIGAVIGIVILAKRPRGSRIGVEVPFAPFLAAGFLLAFYTQWDISALLASLAAL